MRIGIVANSQISGSVEGAKELKKRLGGSVRLFIPKTLGELNHAEEQQPFFSEIDVAVVLGGDGTILSVARVAAPKKVPILGVNLGQVGFLSEVEVSNMEPAIEKLLCGEYSVERRMMLKTSFNGQEHLALNEIGILRKQFCRIAKVRIDIDGYYFDTIVGDGVLIASPTGSTAYSLSAGGPIVSPEAECILVTPVCAHSMHTRPLAVSSKRKIRVEVDNSRGKTGLLVCDGQELGKIEGPVLVERAQYDAAFIRLGEQDFFSRLHQKLEG